ncbi:metallophosphoesterase [Variovorax sp. J22G21]|uniref:metallophosphoesterase n=1 Tax=Variovorax fucosicus TaxID=3053517 RepID=UPI0025760597|nr:MULTISPECIES: metallophosphoesterase [unclassified Variovorax]MDM0041758.1 metallophosphoesterase [Variovorax sp. J22R193]MDM0059597.1 metallophosphoesterase [Variovorax sp. J22G21]
MRKLLIRLLVFAAAVLAMASAWADSDRHVVLVSDLHVGAGKVGNDWNKIEDFRWQADFDSFLGWVAARGGKGSDLVFVGDTFELWQSPTMTCTGDLSNPACKIPDCNEDDTEIGCNEQEALARLEHVIKAHADFVNSLRSFVAAGDHRVFFIPGNHDAALLFSKVQARLLAEFAGLPVTVESRGYWLSGDGEIYSDHGHQFDDLNQFDRWPAPFVDRKGITYLRKPWGENMVQQFYNQYEYVFPIVDNLSDEWTGVKFALDQASFRQTSVAIGKLFRFVLLQESIRQAFIALGEDQLPQWDRKTVRRMPTDFFLDILKPEPRLYAAASASKKSGGLVFDGASLTDNEVDAICAAKNNLAGATPCPKLSTELGAAVKGIFIGKRQMEVDYLRRVLPQVAADPRQVASVYVFGHTHSAVEPATLPLGEMKGGSVNVVHANTGAFQRVASPSQIEAILAQPKMRTKVALDLQPEDLPACYNFVWVQPYKGSPGVKLLRWSQRADGSFADSQGTCLDAN